MEKKIISTILPGTDKKMTPVLEYIQAETGHSFSYPRHLKNAQNIVRLRMIELGIAQETDYLKHCRNDSSEIENIIEMITVGKTCFFRNEPFWQLIEDKVLPNIVRTKIAQKNFELKFWSACCATGEEAYSMVMLALAYLKDHGGEYPWKVSVVGTDINIKFLTEAMQGAYSVKLVERNRGAKKDPHFTQYIQEYFTRAAGSYQASPQLKNTVDFKCLNLCRIPQDLFKSNDLDGVFLKNIGYYLKDEVIEATFAYIAEKINDSGYLFLDADLYKRLKPKNFTLKKDEFPKIPVLQKVVAGNS